MPMVRRAVFTGLLVLAMLPLHSMEPGVEERFFSDFPIVITASKKPESLLDTPATVIVVTQDQIRQRGYSQLKDVLRDLPGIETIEYAWVEQGTVVPVRGIVGNNKIIVLINGMRVNPPGGENMRFGNDMSVRNARQIEVVYGPGSTLYGKDAISAVINIITDSVDKTSLDLGTGLGTNDTRNGWVSFSQRAGARKFSFHTQYFESDLTRLDRAYEGWFKTVDAAAKSLAPALHPFERWESGVNSFFNVEGESSYAQVWYRRDSRSTAEGLKGDGFSYDRRAPWIDSSVVVEAGNEMVLSDNAKLKSILTYNHYEVSPRTRYIFASGDGTTWYMEEWKYALGKGASWQEILMVDVSPRFSFLTGAEFSDIQVVPKASVPGGYDPSKPITGQGGQLSYFTDVSLSTTSRVNVDRVVDYSYQNRAAYLEGTVRLDPVKVIVGGRYDSNSVFGNVFNPRGALIYSVGAQTTLKYIFSRAYVPPAPYFTSTVWENDKQFSVTNNDVKPERATSSEVNASFIGRTLSISASAYLNRQKDLFLPPDANSAANNRGTVYSSLGVPKTLSVPSNAGESTSKGVDFLFSFKKGAGAAWVALSHVDVKFVIAGQNTGLDGISNNNAKMGATFSPVDNVSLSPNFVIRSRPNINDPVILKDEVSRIPYELNLYGTYRSSGRFEWFLDLKNVTNHKYALRGLFTGHPRPQETFRGSLGVILKLI